MYFSRLFSAKKTKVVYLNGLNQVQLSILFSHGGNRTAHKICFKLSIETLKKRRLAKEGAVANIAGRQ